MNTRRSTRLTPVDEMPRALIGLVRIVFALYSVSFALGWLATPVVAQSIRAVDNSALQVGSIEGSLRIADSNKLAANVEVTIRETSQKVTTDEKGRYVFPSVVPGTYTLVATGEGYGRTRITDVVVRPGYELSLSRQSIESRSPNQEPLLLEDYVVSAKKEGVIELDPYEVTGSKQKPFSTTNIDLPRTINNAQAYHIFDEKVIESSGATSIEDFLKNRLTMNAVSLSSGQGTSLDTAQPSRMISTVNLRGLGSDKTLILVNGRRVSGVAIGDGVSLQTYQSDISGIALASIERIEVLPSSASGIYGGSAMGGVVNIILKERYSGGEIRATYENAWNTDSPHREIYLTYGASLDDGKTQIMLNLGKSDTQSILLRDRRRLYERNLARLIHNSPSYIYSTYSPNLGSTPNIANSIGTYTPDFSAYIPDPLELKGGATLSSGITHISPGTTSATPGAAFEAQLLANAGQHNLTLPESVQFPSGLMRTMNTAQEKESVKLNVRRKLGEKVSAYIEATYAKTLSDMPHSPFSAPLYISETSPSNPFTTAVNVMVPVPDIVPLETQAKTTGFLAGLSIDLPRNWIAIADYARSANTFNYKYYTLETVALAADVESGLLNVFRDTLKEPLNLTKYLLPNRFEGESVENEFTLRAAGPFTLPWGTAQLVVGGGRRIDASPDRVRNFENPLVPTNNQRILYFARKQVGDSIYGEITTPMIAEAANVPLIRSLEVQLAGRAERYEVDTGTVAQLIRYNRNPVTSSYFGPTKDGQRFDSRASYVSKNSTMGLKYEPISGITLRASYATAFLPPTPVQLLKNPVQDSFPRSVFDPQLNLQYNVSTISGGNPDLKPENSKSKNIGFIWAPKKGALSGLRINIEYYRIQQFDAIGSLSPAEIVANESTYPDRITRDSSGRITLIDVSLLNLFKRDTEGIDFTANYTTEAIGGIWNVSGVATSVRHIKLRLFPTSPEYDAAGYNPADFGGIPKHKGNIGISYDRPNWSVGWTATYISSYKANEAAGGASSINFYGGADGPGVQAQGSETVDSQIYHDIFASYSTKKRFLRSNVGWRWLLSDVNIKAGVRNVLNHEPPFDAGFASNFYISPYGNSLMRSYWVSVSRTF